MMPNNNRITWIDSMKAFSILAVVLNHTHIVPEIKTIAYIVCLPAFFFAAGLFANTCLSPREFFLNKTLRLLVPFVIWGGLSWLAWLFIGRKYGADAVEPCAWWEPLWGMLCGKTKMMMHNPPLWFLCCMIGLEWVYYALSRIRRKAIRWSIICLLAGIGCCVSLMGRNWFWELSAALIVLPFYAFAAENSAAIRERVVQTGSLFRWMVFGVSLIGVYIGYRYNGDIALAETRIGNPLLYYLVFVSVVGLWMSVSLLLDKYHGIVRALQFIGQNTLLVLCAHVPVFGMIKGMALLCHAPLAFFDTTFGCLCLWVCTFVILLPMVPLLNRFCPWALGKRIVNS